MKSIALKPSGGGKGSGGLVYSKFFFNLAMQ